MRLIALGAALLAASPAWAQDTYSSLNSPVRSVGGTQPDSNGNVTLPTSFANTTCANCAMASPTFTGSPTVNGNPLVLSVNSNLPDAGGNVAIAVTAFVSGFTSASPGTVSSLLSTAPCNSSRLANYAVVSDLYSGASNTNEVLRCTLTGASYYWRPQRTDYVANMTATGGTITLNCLTNAPTIFFTGTLASNQTVTLSTTNCWPGAQFSFANNLTLGIFGLNVGGLIGSTVKSLGLGARGTFYFDGTAWQSF